MSVYICHLAAQHVSHLPVPYGDVFGGPVIKLVIIYFDDIIIFAAILKEHLKRLQAVFTKLREAGLKLSPRSVSFLKWRSCILAM